MSNIKKSLISFLITVIVGFVYFYFMIPALNVHSLGFWFFIIVLITVFTITEVLFSISSNGRMLELPKPVSYLSAGIFVIIGCIVIINVIVSPLFQSKSYSQRITVNENSDFVKDVEAIDINSLPLLDKESSQKLGDRVMGQMPELVSQFYVSDLYTQINYKDQILRVTPLEYNGFFKYLANKDDGIMGYITVDSVTGEAKLTKLTKGMKIMPSGIFSDDLYRTLRFKYPTEIFGEETFEIDNDGNPYWIMPVLKYTGVGLKKDVAGVIILDPITGKSKKYAVKDVPTWVDHVYSADLIIEQVNDWGQYKDGFLNSIFGQKGVVATTGGYNYTVMNDDVYLYTGITSAASDQSNIGFILVNMRTKETKYYAVPGAEEYSAMASAEGQVQQMNYKASFPLLVNLNNKPTYLISLKDDAGLVKMYAFVDVEDYQKVVVTNSSEGIQKAIDNYLSKTNAEVNEDNYKTMSITIKEFNVINVEGNSYYYIVDENGKKYKVLVSLNTDIIPFIHINDQITISYKTEGTVTEILKVE